MWAWASASVSGDPGGVSVVVYEASGERGSEVESLGGT
jgi:hypothetical protein